MAEYVLDTDVLIDILKGHAPTTAAVERLADGGAMLYSTVTEAELHAGLQPDDAGAREATERLLAAMEAIVVDGRVARRAGGYRREFGRSHGTTLPDALVAASAALRGATLVTRNRRHYPMPDLDLVVPDELA